jgi:hypothetical protein
MSKTADLLFRITNGLTLQDQWRMPNRRDGVVAMVRGDVERLRRNAEALAGTVGRPDNDETFYCIDGLHVAITTSPHDHAFVMVSDL